MTLYQLKPIEPSSITTHVVHLNYVLLNFETQKVYNLFYT